jgi:hypothetical protein
VHGEESLLLFPLGLSVDELFSLFMECLSSVPGSSTVSIKEEKWKSLLTMLRIYEV